jgi:SHS2 domain-containing protein
MKREGEGKKEEEGGGEEEEREEEIGEGVILKRYDKFRYLDHMTDLIVEAYGNTLEELFENSAIGLVNAMFETSKVDVTDSLNIMAEGYDFKSLLYDWIEKIILSIYIDKMIITKFDSLSFSTRDKDKDKNNNNNNNNKTQTTSSEEKELIANDLYFSDSKGCSLKDNIIYILECIGKGEKINLDKHEYKVEVKSITYHEMQIKRNQNGYYTVRFLVDL